MTREVLKVVEVLLIEDSAADADLVIEAMKGRKVRAHLSVVRNGEEAMSYLRREGSFVNSVQPDLILLDLNLPKKDGREVLREVKADPFLCSIPVVILTSSAADSDIRKSYQLHANCYIIKPVDFESFAIAVNQLFDFWFSLVVLPRVHNE